MAGLFRRDRAGSAGQHHPPRRFYIAKARFYEWFSGQLNARQGNVVARMFREGIDGFEGGLSAENYISIAQTSRATATRDLQNLGAMGALIRAGELRHTRYYLNFADRRDGSQTI